MKALNLFITIAATTLLTSCFTEGYNFGEIDGEIGSDVDITLPRFGTASVELRNVLNLEKDGILKVLRASDGTDIYAISQCKTFNADLEIGQVRISKPSISDFNSSLDLMVHNEQQAFGLILPDYTYSYTIGEDKAKQTWRSENSPRVSADLERIDQVTLYENELRYFVKVEGLENIIPYAHFDNVVLTVPEDVHFKRATIAGHPAKRIERGRIVLTDEVEAQRFALSGVHVLLEIDTIDTGHDLQLDPATHSLKFQGDLQMTGTLRMEGAEILAYHPEYAKEPAQVPEKVKVTGHSEFYDDLVAHTFSGRVRREVEPQDVEIKELPSLLTENDVVVDLSEPMIFATLVTPLKASTTVKASISSKSMLPEKCITPTMKVEGGGKENKFYLGCSPAPRYFPKDTPETQYSEYQYEEVSNLRRLLSYITTDKKLTLEVEPIEVECKDIEVLGSHQIEATEEIFVPLSFGEDFKLVYQGTKDSLGLGSGFEQITLSSDALIEVQGVANSSLPMDALLTIKLLNAAGEDLSEVVELANLAEEEDSETRQGVMIGAMVEKQPFRFILKAKEGHNLMDLLNPGPSQLDGIHYRAVAQKPAGNEALHPNTGINIDDILIHVRAQVAIGN